MIYNSFKVLTYYFNLILNFNFYIKYHFEKANVKTDTFTKISDCILNNENERI